MNSILPVLPVLPSVKPIVWTIAASDSGGGAGIQADLKTFFDLGVHGCSVLTAVTAQNTQGVQAIESVSTDMMVAQLHALIDDLLPAAVKIGVLPNVDSVNEVLSALQYLKCPNVIWDTVLSPTMGINFVDADTRKALVQLFPYVGLLTPNIPEAEILSGIKITNATTQQQAAEKLRAQGASAVLIKGGHTNKHICQDYFLSAQHAFWLSQPKLDNPHTHGTGCTLSSAIAAFMAHGKPMHDAVVLANAYVNKGIRLATSLDNEEQKTGSVLQTAWPDNIRDFPKVSFSANAIHYQAMPVCDTRALGLYPVVDSITWLEKLLPLGVKTLQLRIKDLPLVEVEDIVKQAVQLGRHYKARLFINDYWQLAIKYQAYGVHLGQEDMADADVDAIRQAGLHLGISTHGEYEFSYAATFKPSYIAIGAIFPTDTKEVVEVGLNNLYQWAAILKSGYPLVAIGGINLTNIDQVLLSEVGSVAVVSAITKEKNYPLAVEQFNAKLMAAKNFK